jgi:hypothetical protein
MYISKKAAFVRNVALAGVNGTITLIVLLIAPLGLFAVITNTLLVTASTFLVSTAMDFVAKWLLPPTHPARKMSYWQSEREIEPTREIERHRRD